MLNIVSQKDNFKTLYIVEEELNIAIRNCDIAINSKFRVIFKNCDIAINSKNRANFENCDIAINSKIQRINTVT